MKNYSIRLIIWLLLAIAVAFAPPRLHAQQPEAFTNSIGMKFVSIPAGEFMMGAEEDRNETINFFPLHRPQGTRWRIAPAQGANH
ncbi:MAG TPA: hypothetical protein VMV10_20720 [Pirellulales bacterium]|nr:hypothetical protein [Pirellulales bacterium]